MVLSYCSGPETAGKDDFPSGALSPPCDEMGNYMREILRPEKGYLDLGFLKPENLLPAASALLSRLRQASSVSAITCGGEIIPPRFRTLAVPFLTVELLVVLHCVIQAFSELVPLTHALCLEIRAI